MEWWQGAVLAGLVALLVLVVANAWRRDHPRPRRVPDRVALVERMPLEYITPDFVKGERNTEVRAVLLRRLGIERWGQMVGMAKTYHKDDYGTIWEDSLGLYRAVVVVNSSPSPDGTFKDYWLRLPAQHDRQPPRFCGLCGISIATDITSAKQGVAWTFGLCTAHYAPTMVS